MGDILFQFKRQGDAGGSRLFSHFILPNHPLTSLFHIWLLTGAVPPVSLLWLTFWWVISFHFKRQLRQMLVCSCLFTWGGSWYWGSTEELVCIFGWPIHQNYRTVISWTIFAALSPLLFIINYAANLPFYTSFTSYILLHTRLNIALRLPTFSFYKIWGGYISEICARVPPEALSKFYDCINYAANLPFYTSFTSYILLHRLESLHSVSIFSIWCSWVAPPFFYICNPLVNLTHHPIVG